MDTLLDNKILEQRFKEVPQEVLLCLEKLGWHTPEWEKPTYLWEWQEAVVWSLSKEWFTLRVPKNSDTIDKTKIRSQVTNQMNFFYGMIGWLASGSIDDSIRVPLIWNDPTVDTWLPEWVITMQTVKWRTLLYYAMLQELEWRFKTVDEMLLAKLTDEEILLQYFDGNKKRFIDMFALDKLWELFWEDLKSKFDTAIRFLERKWLEHWDIHLWNVMIVNEHSWRKIIYLIDFWKSTIHYKSQPIIQSGRDYYLSNYSLIWN
jgi:tRNA A-37 threonylcarbamoyl transferase component Bud32